MGFIDSIIHSRKVRRTTLIGLGCLSFLLGMGAVKLGWQLHSFWWLVLAAALLFGCIGKRRWVAVPAIILAGAVAGVVRGSVFTTELTGYAPLVGQKVVVTGKVIDDATYGNKGQHDFRLQDVRVDGRSPPGTVRVTTYGLADVRRGDTVQAAGKLYDGFGNYQAAIYYAEVTVLAKNTSPVEQLRRQFAASLYSVLPDTQASLGLGILVGIKTQLPDTLDDQLKVLSLTHIVVASGYNLTVLVRLARTLFERRSKYQTALASFGLMAGFVAVTGFSPSMSRAALVTGLSVLAWYYGRRIHPIVLLLFVAAITAGIDPLYLWGDIGWWLSFLAFAGVLIVAPLVEHRLFGERKPRFIGQIIIETAAAQVMALPLLLLIFGNPSLLSLLANVLIVPLVPLVMLLTFIGGTAGLLVPWLAATVALPAGWLLAYVTQLVGLLAGVEWAKVPLKIDTGTMLCLYGLVAGLCILWWRKTRHDFLGRSVIE